MTEVYADTAEFRDLVRRLRAIAPEFRVMALYAATFWTDERVREEIPGREGARLQ